MDKLSNEEFLKIIEERQFDKCKECGNKVELVFEDFAINVEDIELKVEDLPQLKCINCGKMHLSIKSKIAVKGLYNELKKMNRRYGRYYHKNDIKKSYNFCKEYDFEYDHRDYENIPGLIRPSKDGFLTPVYFEKDILIYFFHSPEYELKIFSESYGTLGYKEHFIVPFGINKNQKVIFWLGDLDKLDDKTLQFLKIHNIPSEHILTGTEFYDAQINCIFSEPILEKQIINMRNKLYDNLKKYYSLNLHHLENEVLNILDDIKKPITYSDIELKSVIGALHKILIEAVNKDNFIRFYENIKDKNDRKKDYKKMGSIKYYEFLLGYLADEEINIKDMIFPLYLLNDLRIIYSHLVPEIKEKKIKENIINTLGLESFEQNNEEIYNKLVNKLKSLFEYYNSQIEG